jgi:hypothetical protein
MQFRERHRIEFPDIYTFSGCTNHSDQRSEGKREEVEMRVDGTMRVWTSTCVVVALGDEWEAKQKGGKSRHRAFFAHACHNLHKLPNFAHSASTSLCWGHWWLAHGKEGSCQVLVYTNRGNLPCLGLDTARTVDPVGSHHRTPSTACYPPLRTLHFSIRNMDNGLFCC